MKVLCVIVYLLISFSLTESLVSFNQSECGKIKSCLRWSSCKLSNCDFGLSWKMIEYNSMKYLEIELVGRLINPSNGYLALGFSKDDKMANNGVVSCQIENQNTSISAGYNLNHKNEILNDENIDSNFFLKYKDILYGVEFDSVTNILRCRFLRLIHPTMKVENLKDLADGKYFLLTAKSNFMQNKLTYHKGNKRPSLQSYDLTSTEWINSIIQSDYVLIKLHACLMVFGWIFCATNGIIIANFYKSCWSTKSWFGEKVWFQLHRLIQSICILCVSAAFIIIFVHVSGYSTLGTPPDSAHPVMGIVATGFLLANPIMALFRCSPNHSSRWIFNSAHFLVGITGYVLAISTIMIGIKLPPAGKNLSNISYPWKLVAIYLGLIIILFIYGEIRNKLINRAKINDSSRLNVSSTLIEEINHNYQFGYHVLIISVVISFGFGIAFIAIILSN